MKNKINVNISPNPLDLQTLHCSQNDTGERKFYFTLHNNGEVIDTTDISDPIFEPFDVYKGGTEQLLPVNTDDPTTSPIIADIQYSDGLREDQSFTYRESPVTKDGKAKVNVLKGNSLVWNQLVQNITGTSASDWVTTGGTLTVSDDTLSYSATSVESEGSNRVRVPTGSISLVSGHKYLYAVTHKENRTGLKFAFSAFISTGYIYVNSSTSWKTDYAIVTETATKNWVGFAIRNGVAVSDSFDVKNAMIFDLTAMGLDITDPSEFTSLFPLPYYSYDSGSMLDFKGAGIKTVGFNQWDEEWEVGNINASTGQNEAVNTCIRSKNYMPLLPNTTYYFYGATGNGGNVKSRFYDASFNYLGSSPVFGPYNAFTPPSDAKYYRFALQTAYGVAYKNDICINISSDRNGEYEPYTTSTTTIPTDTYFPTGMKSAGTVYDEFTSSRAYTRVGEVDLGSLTWRYRSDVRTGLFSADVNDSVLYSLKRDVAVLSALYEYKGIVETVQSLVSTTVYPNMSCCVYFHTSNPNRIIYAINNSYSDATAFKTAMDGVYLYYELATYTEQDIKTASLVCKNIDTPCYLSNGELVCDAIEDLTSESGFFDAKLKLKDSSSVAYSSKFKLHVEDL